MEKLGRILKIDTNTQSSAQIVTVLLDTPEAELCAIKTAEQETQCGISCAGGCSGCNMAGIERGVFAVQGNIIKAVNTAGVPLASGEKVRITVPDKKALLQAAVSIGIPALLAVFAYIVLFMQTKSEQTAVQAAFGGLFLGALFAFGVNHLLKDRSLPEVTERL